MAPNMFGYEYRDMKYPPPIHTPDAQTGTIYALVYKNEERHPWQPITCSTR